jgi:hypothetical protein
MRTGWIIAAIIVILLGVWYVMRGGDETAPAPAASGEAAMTGEAAST